MDRDPITRSQIEDFLYHEAALLDAWKLDEWLALLTDDARYRIPSNDAPNGDPARLELLDVRTADRVRPFLVELLGVDPTDVVGLEDPGIEHRRRS